MTHNDYPTWLEIDLSAVEQNARYLIHHTGSALLAAIKANAYGHGAVEIGKAALAGGASWLGVARYSEAHTLRQAGITAPILILGILTPSEINSAIAEDITLALPSLELVDIISAAAGKLNKKATVHMVVDTGMGRLGVLPEQALTLAKHITASSTIELNGIFSHFAMSDFKDHPMMAQQLANFNLVLDQLAAAGIQPKWVHHANTGATLALPDARYNMVRAGQGVLGLNPFSYRSKPKELKPALTAWKARLVSCKSLPKGWSVGYGAKYTTTQDEIIGVVSVGFGDGLRRVDGYEVLIGGQRVPVVGATCMDQIMIRLPREFPLYEEVVIVGSQGNETITIEELASVCGTVHVDITTLINQRVPRVYYHS